MIHLHTVTFRPPTPEQATRFPFTVPAISSLVGKQWIFETPVTLLVGENGSGKSTLLEALAVAIGSITVGSVPAEQDQSLRQTHPLAESLKLSWSRKTRRGFFLRAEDFFGYVQHQHRLREEYEAELRKLDTDHTLSDAARGYAKLPYGRELGDLRRRYGEGLDAVSHGESFLALFQARFVPDGLYLLDEPEAPLSPLRQLALLSLIKHAVDDQGAQYIIATHSPILLAIPEATIWLLSDRGVQRVAYEELEHVQLMRDFLNHPEQFLQHL
jgi:predicted ATPase